MIILREQYLCWHDVARGSRPTFSNTASNPGHCIREAESGFLQKTGGTLPMDEKGLRGPGYSNLCYPGSKFTSSVHDHAFVWFIEDIHYARRDVREKSHGVPDL